MLAMGNPVMDEPSHFKGNKLKRLEEKHPK